MYANLQLQTQLAQQQMAILENLQASMTQLAPGKENKNSSLPALSRNLLLSHLPQFSKWIVEQSYCVCFPCSLLSKPLMESGLIYSIRGWLVYKIVLSAHWVQSAVQGTWECILQEREIVGREFTI